MFVRTKRGKYHKRLHKSLGRAICLLYRTHRHRSRDLGKKLYYQCTRQKIRRSRPSHTLETKTENWLCKGSSKDCSVLMVRAVVHVDTNLEDLSTVTVKRKDVFSYYPSPETPFVVKSEGPEKIKVDLSSKLGPFRSSGRL